MQSVNRAIFKTLAKNDDFCCLCFNSISDFSEMFHVNDKIFLNKEETELLDIAKSLLGPQFINNITDYICKQCSETLIKSYNFIVMCKHNIEHLYNAIESLNFCLGNILPNLDNYKTLYVSLDTRNYTSEQYYDDRPAVTPDNASKRFKSISNPKLAKPLPKETKKPPKLKQNKQMNFVDIPTKDMMLNPDDWSKYQCKECQKVYPRSYNLRQHFIRVHAPKDFQCPYCPKTFGALSILELHKAESHTPSQCKECGKKYNTIHGLKMHEVKHTRSYMCHKCGKHYQTRNMYKNHIENNLCNKKKKSKSEAEYQCDHCSKKFCTINYLKSHIRFFHGNGQAHVCEWCNKKFHARSSLMSHIVKHTKEKNFCCEICGGRFVTQESLRYHSRIHTGERPYKCDFCDARFSSASGRMDHMRRHHLEPSIQCDECDVKVKTTGSLVIHKKKHDADRQAVSNLTQFSRD